MRNDINDMKRLLLEMRGYGVATPAHTEPRKELAGLLPQPSASSVEFDDSAEIVDEQLLPASKADMQREQIVRALRRNNGSRRAAAAELFMSERTLYRRIKELGIDG